MKNSAFLIISFSIFLLVKPINGHAQNFPPFENNKTWWVAPLVLTGGAIAIGTENFKEKENAFHQKHFSNFQTSFEDYLQYSTGLVYLGANLTYDKKTILEASKIFLTANIFNFIGTKGMKFLAQIERPNKADYYSFPSGHTSLAFVGAHLIAREFGKGKPWIKVGAYGIATTTGLFRWGNHEHWVSDILGGAAMGIFATEMAIRHLPKIMDKIDKNGHLSYEPYLLQQGGGMAISYHF